VECNVCGYRFGPVAYFLDKKNGAICPESSDSFSYVDFECSFQTNLESPLSFDIAGDCPPYVSSLIVPNSHDVMVNIVDGHLLHFVGANDELRLLHTSGLQPYVGDVIVSIDGLAVSHLNEKETKRVIERQRLKNLENGNEKFHIIFRRHCVERTKVAIAIALR
jgi:hypothetical protein